MHKQKGFSLIELLIVVAIILIIAAIAIPNLLRSRIAAHEASAVGSLRTINTAQVTYASTFPASGFSVALAQLGPGSGVSCTGATTATACLLDNVLGCSSANASGLTCTKSGYNFSVTTTGSAPVFYQSNGSPQTLNTGTRYFYSDASGVIRYNTLNVATSTDNPLQ